MSRQQSAGSVRVWAIVVALLPMLAPAPTDALPPLHQNLLWSAPAVPVAGEPAQVAFEAFAVDGFEYHFRSATLEGSTLVLAYDLTGTVTGTDLVLVQRVFIADVPALPPGPVTVLMRGHWPDGSVGEEPAGVLQVAAHAAAAAVLPAQGYWAAPARPGSGLFLEHKGPLLAAAVYSYQDRAAEMAPAWWLGTASPVGDTAVALLHAYGAGGCLGCDTPATPRASPANNALRLRFESARRAWVDINGTATLPMVSLPYGAAYAPVTLTDTVDAEFGPLPLPDLRGGWVLVLEDQQPPTRPVRLHFDALEVTDDGAVFTQGEDARLACRGADAQRRAGCEYQWTGFVFDVPPPGGFPEGPVWFALGDIEEDRMRGTIAVGDAVVPVRAFRLPDTFAGAP